MPRFAKAEANWSEIRPVECRPARVMNCQPVGFVSGGWRGVGSVGWLGVELMEGSAMWGGLKGWGRCMRLTYSSPFRRVA